jgi:hypothetical protein
VRIEIVDQVMQSHVITTGDPRIAGDWFGEIYPLIASANTCYQNCRITVWPSTPEEMKTIGDRSVQVRFTQDGLLHLADVILKASGRLAELEAADA